MVIHGFEPSRRVSSLLKGLFRRQRSILFSLAKTKKINWNRPPLPFLGYMSSSAILLLQNFSPTNYRPPLPSRLLTRCLKPSKTTTNQFYYLLPKSYKLSLLTANIASLVFTTLNLKPIIETNTEYRKYKI